MKQLFYIIPLTFIMSCSSNSVNNDTENVNDTIVSKETISFSEEQIELAGIELGKVKKQKISESIECSGTIYASSKNTASVSPIMEGFIKKLNYYPGDFVEKGATLASLQHPNFIILQQQYIEAKSQSEYYQEEYKRQGELTIENAASIKKMQKAKADFLSYESTYKSLKAQLELLGVNTANIEKGDFIKNFKLLAPIKGTISQLNANIGKLVSPENHLYEIINDITLNLSFNVFEKDIAKIKPGQKIVFWSLNDNKKHEAKVKRVGINIDYDNHTALIHSAIENETRELKPGMFINASVFINERDSYTVPTDAIVDFNGETFIFIKTNNEFNIVKITKGIEQNNFFEIVNADDNIINSEIVVKGAYFLLAKLETLE
ncbi:MAG: efflux RND transporter periplasmic adaptor subunit [Bacteroidales bacterium]|jgi:cobalt-zinc-cadmium efflux system membrane fusion protein|nr:efflux RND transporter periplasmic adaptor subunit [Bacteroidales bacterium]